MIRRTKEQADPEMVAITALAFIAEDPERLACPHQVARGKSNALLAGVRRSTLRVTRVRAVSSAI